MVGHAPFRVALLVVAGFLIIYTLFESQTAGKAFSIHENFETEITSTFDHAHGNTSVPTIGKVTMLYGDWAQDEINQAVLNTHRDHAEQQGYSIHVLDRKIMHGMWSKLSYMLMLVLQELTKPKDQRLKWLFWFDLDIVVTNANIDLGMFLPPGKDFKHIHLLVTNDHNGLNSGSFFIRVNEWSVKYLADIMALQNYKPELRLKYTDQSAQEVLTLDPRYVNNTMYVPQRWFNAYRGPRNRREQLIPGAPVPDNTIKPGDVQLHFAGKKVKHLIPTYLKSVKSNSMGWQMPVEQTNLTAEVEEFYGLELARIEADAKLLEQEAEKSREGSTEMSKGVLDDGASKGSVEREVPRLGNDSR